MKLFSFFFFNTPRDDVSRNRHQLIVEHDLTVYSLQWYYFVSQSVITMAARYYYYFETRRSRNSVIKKIPYERRKDNTTRRREIRGNSPKIGDDDAVVSVDAHHADVLHHDPRDQHADQGGEGGQGEEPSPEVSRDAEGGEAEELAARGCLLAEYRVHDAPEKQA